MNNVYCEKHKCYGKKGKFSYYCPICMDILSANLDKNRS